MEQVSVVESGVRIARLKKPMRKWQHLATSALLIRSRFIVSRRAVSLELRSWSSSLPPRFILEPGISHHGVAIQASGPASTLGSTCKDNSVNFPFLRLDEGL